MHGVSILVVMERTHRPRPRPATWCHHELVSILVVMERTHRPHAAVSSSARHRCFNPCCDGTDSSTRLPMPTVDRDIGVSILVVMERTHRHAHCGRSCPSHCAVSILVVMERTHRPASMARTHPALEIVSILVVMERTHRLDPSSIADDDRRRQVSILVVMERTHRHRPSSSGQRARQCFNPCCDGTDSST